MTQADDAAVIALVHPTQAPELFTEQALAALLRRTFAELAPIPHISLIDWAETYRILSAEEASDFPGRYSLENTPALRGILAALSLQTTRRVVVQKAAQMGYTAGVVCNVLAYHIAWRPAVQVVMFPRIQSAKDFEAEKFAPMVRATPTLSRRIRLKSRADGNSATRKKYAGGSLKFVASNSPSDVKSTSARVRIVEEPDDVNQDVRGQGNSIALLRERGKTIRESLELVGGTPTAKGASAIESEIRTTDQRRFLVACHHCEERHEVEWQHVTIPGLNLSDEELKTPEVSSKYPERDVYGRGRWEDAYYSCPHCGGIWSDDERVANIRAAARIPPYYGWEPTAPEYTDPGFYCNELQSVFEGSFVPALAKKYLEALDKLNKGDATHMVAFWNSTRGMAWEYKGELPEEDELAARAEKYAEWSVPSLRAVEAHMTVDVQHDRLAVTVWVEGRGQEMWLAFWGELYGQTIVPHQGAWIELEQLMTRTVRHPTGVQLPIMCVGIDCSDGQTSDASYAFVRRHDRPGVREVLALKGAPDAEGRIEIWTPPRASIDPNHRATKASRAGVTIHIVGTAKAKDLLLGWSQEAGRIRLEGEGAGRLHWYEGVRGDFFEQLLSEIKVPSRTNQHRRVWKPLLSRRNEALDCTVYAIYLSRHRRLHLRRALQWDWAEQRLRQMRLLPDDDAATPPAAPAEVAQPVLPGVPAAKVAPQVAQISVPVSAAVPTAASLPAPRTSTAGDAAVDALTALLEARQHAHTTSPQRSASSSDVSDHIKRLHQQRQLERLSRQHY